MANRPLAPSVTRVIADKRLLFILAGLGNTAVDFVFFNLALVVLGFAPWLANIASTSVAMSISFLVNKHAVFRDGRTSSYRQFVAFVAVTAAGLWGLQTVIVVAATGILHPVARELFGLAGRSAQLLVPNVAKILATIASAVWNYFWYDRVIFAKTPPQNKPQEWL